jgi:hypothetical protein
MDREQFLDAIAKAQPGDWVKESRSVARAARDAYSEGIVELVQRRVSGPFSDDSRCGEFDHVAIVRERERRPKVRGPWLEETGATEAGFSCKRVQLQEIGAA